MQETSITGKTSYYDGISKGYNELHGAEQKRKFEIILSELKKNGLSSESTLLDIGCGTCLSFDFFPCKVHGVEPSMKMIKQHKKHKELMVEKMLFNAPAEETDNFFDKKFKFIICVTSAHHFENPKKVFEAMKKLSNKNTIFAFSLLKGKENFMNLIEKEFEIKKIIRTEKTTDTIVLFQKQDKYDKQGTK